MRRRAFRFHKQLCVSFSEGGKGFSRKKGGGGLADGAVTRNSALGKLLQGNFMLSNFYALYCTSFAREMIFMGLGESLPALGAWDGRERETEEKGWRVVCAKSQEERQRIEGGGVDGDIFLPTDRPTTDRRPLLSYIRPAQKSAAESKSPISLSSIRSLDRGGQGRQALILKREEKEGAFGECLCVVVGRDK